MFKAATQELVDALVAAEPGPAAEDALFGLFAEYVVQNYSAELQTYRCAAKSAMGLYVVAWTCVLLMLLVLYAASVGVPAVLCFCIGNASDSVHHATTTHRQA